MPRLTLNRQRLRDLGCEQHLRTDREIAEAINVPASYFSNVNCGRRPPNHRFIAACLTRFPVAFDELFTVVVDEPSTSQVSAVAA